MHKVREEKSVDVAIIGAGLAGLCLARQVSIQAPSLRVLVLDKKHHIPGTRQKVGESTVQLGAYYLGKKLDLESHLLQKHLLKYNLRFYWPSANSPTTLETYSQVYARNFSNIPCYQIDRNVFEAELLGSLSKHPSCEIVLGAGNIDYDRMGEGKNRIHYELDGFNQTIHSTWVVDTTGRRRLVSQKEGKKSSPAFQHGSAHFWMDCAVDIEKLTDLSHAESLRHPSRKSIGHQPLSLATNHFMGEGFWFWVIPLRGKTSFGLVYDKSIVSENEVMNPEKLQSWLVRHFPLFKELFKKEKVSSFGRMPEFVTDCDTCFFSDGLLLSGESGRFLDPLYSPGTDFIALHNDWIVDLIQGDIKGNKNKLFWYEQMSKSCYQAFVPSFSVGYTALGSPEVFALKYTWELSIYFAFFTYPYINNIFTSGTHIVPLMKRMAALGKLNEKFQYFLRDYYYWRTQNEAALSKEPIFHELYDSPLLIEAEKLFYCMGDSGEKVMDSLDRMIDSLKDYLFWVEAKVGAHISSQNPLKVSYQQNLSEQEPSLEFQSTELKQKYLQYLSLESI